MLVSRIAQASSHQRRASNWEMQQRREREREGGGATAKRNILGLGLRLRSPPRSDLPTASHCRDRDTLDHQREGTAQVFGRGSGGPHSPLSSTPCHTDHPPSYNHPIPNRSYGGKADGRYISLSPYGLLETACFNHPNDRTGSLYRLVLQGWRQTCTYTAVVVSDNWE
jgi:hypothetical protein